MPTLSDLVTYCDTLTRRTSFQDAPGAFNGLQVENDGRVTKIGAAVDAGLVPFQKAVEAKVDFLIVHHGAYWDMPQTLTGPVRLRFKSLLDANCALYSSHLPLDAHPVIGNNALILGQLGLSRSGGFAPNEGGDIGALASYGKHRSQLRARLEALYPRVIAIEYGSESPGTIAVCSGSGNSALKELAGSGVDTLVTGELREEWFNVAQERRMNLYLCGHYATEVHAVQALAAELSARFNLPYEFITTDNPL